MEMRIIHTDEIISNLKEMCMEANLQLSPDMKEIFNRSSEKEESPVGKRVLGQLKENLEIAGKEEIPICQDTGMAVVLSLIHI